MSRKAYSDNPQSVQTPQDVDYMGIENGGTGLPYMKKIQVGNLLRKERDRLNDLETEIQEVLKGQDLDPNKDVEVLDARINSDGVVFPTLSERLDSHEKAIMPHQFVDESTGKTYRYGFQISETGKPQTIYEEIL